MAAEKKVLKLKSVAGAEPMEYRWPLTCGRGNVKGAEDEHDQASEIVESIRWVGVDWPEVMEDMGSLLKTYDRKDWTCMNRIVDTFNKAVDRMRVEVGKDKAGKYKDRTNTRTSRMMLRHVIQQVYNTAILNPNELNHYEPFTPEVYGETSFDLINQMIDQISPITSENKFLDLGSGVGQVVLQVAALTDCELCVGVEKAIIPSTRAIEMDSLFKKWMAWYGKKYSPYKLYQGDFLTPEHRKTISESTIVFVNNYAFGPEVDHMLKERFADLKDGARIVSSKPFCPLNFRITERNLSDIGTIMHVSVMDPLQGSVSWTDKPVSYYLHIIDSTKLERYFNRQQSHHTTRSRFFRRGHSLLDLADSASNGSMSRASSLEKELDSPVTQFSTASGEDSDNTSKSKGKGRGRNKKKFTKKKSTPRTDGRVAKVTSFLNHLEGKVEDMETTPDNSVPPSRGESPQNPDSPDTQSAGGTTGRPVRAAVVNAAAITEAQNDILSSLGKRASKMKGRGKYKHLNEGDRLPRPMKTGPKKVITKKVSPPSSIFTDMLDELHEETMNKITECNDSSTLPFGCTNESLNVLPPDTLYHEEVPFHLQTGEKDVPHGLHILLETMKKQYLTMIQTMQTKEFSENIKEEIDREKQRKENLTKRVKQLENQIDGLIQDSLGLLKARMKELGIAAHTPTEFTEQAKNIVCSHTELLKKKGGLESEIRRLELEQEQMVQSKEKELLEQLLSQKSGNDVNVVELKQYVQREIRSCFDVRNQGNQLPKLSSDVTLTKVGAPEKLMKKEEDVGLGLPKMELKLPDPSVTTTSYTISRSEDRRYQGQPPPDSLDSRSRAELDAAERNKILCAPKAADDYEDRVKMIITKELAKEKEGEKTVSPSKEQSRSSSQQLEQSRSISQQLEQPRSSAQQLDQQRRRPPPPPVVQQRPRNIDPRMGGMLHDPRMDPRGFPPGALPPDTRAPQDMRLVQDPRLVSPLQGPRSLPSPGLRRADSRGSNHENGGVRYEGRGPPAGYPGEGRGTSYPPPDSSRPPTSLYEQRNASSSGLSSQHLMSMTVEKAIQNQQQIAVSSASRMSLIIEESVRREAEKDQQRNVYSAVVKSGAGEMMEGLACPRGTASPQERKPLPLPQVEGLAARFDSYFEKANKEKPGSRPGSHNTSSEGLGARFSSPDPVQSAAGSRPTSTGSKSSLHTPDPAQQESESKKRLGSPLMSPGAGKKPYLDEETGKRRDPDDTRRWQDEISMGFDRLVAMASEVDKRRKSSENSPAHNSPRKGDGSRPPTGADIRMLQESNPYGDPATLASKIKAGLLGPVGREAGGGKDGGRGGNLPGENLPEHHFKKKYFNQEFQRQQEETLRSARDKVDPGPRGQEAPRAHEGSRGYSEGSRLDYGVRSGYDQQQQQARWEGPDRHASSTHNQRIQMERQRMEQQSRQLQEQRAYFEQAARSGGGDPRLLTGAGPPGSNAGGSDPRSVGAPGGGTDPRVGGGPPPRHDPRAGGGYDGRGGGGGARPAYGPGYRDQQGYGGGPDRGQQRGSDRVPVSMSGGGSEMVPISMVGPDRVLQGRPGQDRGPPGMPGQDRGPQGQDRGPPGMHGQDRGPPQGISGQDRGPHGMPGQERGPPGMPGQDRGPSGMTIQGRGPPPGQDRGPLGMTVQGRGPPQGMPGQDRGPPGMDRGPPGMPGQDRGPPGMPGQDRGPPGMPGQDRGPPGIPGQGRGPPPGMPGQDRGPPGMPVQGRGPPQGMPGQDRGQLGLPGQDRGPPGMPGQDRGQLGLPGQDRGPPGMPGQDRGPPGMPGQDRGPPGMPGQDRGPPGIPGQDRGPLQGMPGARMSGPGPRMSGPGGPMGGQGGQGQGPPVAYYNQQQMMQAAAYRQQMIYGNRPPPPPPHSQK